MGERTKTFAEVLLAEEHALRERRFRAQKLQAQPLPTSCEHNAPVESVASGDPTAAADSQADNAQARDAASSENHELEPFPRTGLALSGGGIRSASFGLGFLQAMYRHGVLRQIDYLSTVSGGSYVGSHLSSSIVDEERINWKPTDRTQKVNGREKLSLLPEESGRQHANILRLRRGGSALNKPLVFFNRHVLGVILLNLTAISAVVAVAALLAIAYRALYVTEVSHVLSELGFSGDLRRPWAPTVFLFVMWIWTSWLSRQHSVPNPAWESRWRRINVIVFTLLVASIFMAIASLLTVGDMSVPAVANESNEIAVRDRADVVSKWITNLIFAGLIAAMLPYLSPMKLIRSGVDPKSAKDKWVFAIASRAVLFGAPLIVFGFLCRENISGYNETRDNRYEFAPQSISNWHAFWARVEREACIRPEDSISGKLWQIVKSVPADNVHSEEDKASQLIYLTLPLADAITRRSQSLDVSLLWNPFTLGRRVRERNNYLRWREKITRQLNRECLSNRQFYLNFAPRSDQSTAKLDALLTKAEKLDLILQSYHGEYQHQPQLELADGFLDQVVRYNEKLLEDGDTSEDDRLAAHLAVAKFLPLLQEIRKTNWELLRETYGKDSLRSPYTVFAYVVLEADQKHRFKMAIFYGGVFLVLGFLLPLNRISIHSFYRRQLGNLWIKPSGKNKTRIPMEELDTVSRGGPYHLINATMNLFGSTDHEGRNPTQLFFFSHLYCGSYLTGFQDSDDYEGETDLANAMAISGAAINPLVSRNPLVRVLLLLANFRLGQWLPNPNKRVEGRFETAPITALMSALLWDPIHRSHCSVTDGGLRDNTGVESLLHRRCRVIIAVDASADGDCRFTDLLRLIRTQRVKFGRKIVGSVYEDAPSLKNGRSHTDDGTQAVPHLSLNRLKPKEGSRVSRSHFVVAEIRYPRDRFSDNAGLGENSTGYLIYVKPSFNGDEPSELVHHAHLEPSFPHDPTYDQFFDEQKFECYRQLGEHIGNDVWRKLFQAPAESADKFDRQQQEMLGKKYPGDTPWLSLWDPTQANPPRGSSPELARTDRDPAEIDNAVDHTTTEIDADQFLENWKSQEWRRIIEDFRDEYQTANATGRLALCDALNRAMDPTPDRKTRRKICTMLIDQLDTEEAADVREAIFGILFRYGNGLKEVNEIFE